MNINFKLILIVIAILSISCNNRKMKKIGKIDVEIIVYNDPSNNIYDVVRIPISTLYFNDEKFIEELPSYTYSDAYSPLPYVLISDNKYARFKNLNAVEKVSKFNKLALKKIGLKFFNDTINNYNIKKIMTDTSFNGYNYKRVSIATKEDFTVFYIHQTDTILPFSLSTQFDNDFNGILNRVDTYEFKEDRFTSLRMHLSDTIPENFYKALKKLK